MAEVLLSHTKYIETIHSATMVPPRRPEQLWGVGENTELG